MSQVLKALQDKLIRDHALRVRLNQCVDLPSPPGVAVRILQLGENPDVPIADIAEAIQFDPALAAKIIRIANSPIYAQRRKSENLRQALMLLGLNATMTLALSFSLVKTLRSDKQEGLDYVHFWRHCITTAALCRALSEKMSVLPVEDLFLTGLLKGIGILAIDKIAPDLYAGAGDTQYHRPTLRQQEKQALGADHSMIGGWLLAHWNFPEALVYGVGFEPQQAGELPADYVDIVNISSAGARLADVLLTRDIETAMTEAATKLSTDSGLEQEEIAGVIENVCREIRELGALFEIDVGEPEYLQSIAARAKEVLMIRSLQTLRETAALQESHSQLENKTRELEVKSERDALTGLYNRAYFDHSIKQEFDFAETNGSPLAIVFVDLDHFKAINDAHGHQSGDKVLAGTGQTLLKSIRSGDIAARYGGEEFVLIFPGISAAGARIATDRLLRLFQNTAQGFTESESITVTASIGVAIHNDGASRFDSAEALLRAADRAVYAAKHNGRNQVCFYGAGD